MRSRRWRELGISIVPAALVALLLGLQLSADPATGVTFSDAPFTDEGFYVMPSRNMVLLGQWVTDEWQLVWVELPFSVVVAGVFELFGVGILQARMVSLVATVVAVYLVTRFVRRHVGIVPALLGGAALGTCSLLLYYGRLAILEPMVLLFLVVGFVLLLSDGPRAHPVLVGALAGLAIAAAIGTKPSAIAAAAGLLTGAALSGPHAVPGLWRRVAAAVAVIGVAGAIWLVLVLADPEVLPAILALWPPQDLPRSPIEAWERVVSYVANSDGAIPMTAPLLVGSFIGIAFAAWHWRRSDPVRRAIVLTAAGWLVVGIVLVLLVPYRPNRYVVPLLPPMALLTAIAVATVLDLLSDRRAFTTRPSRVALPALVLALAVAVPGVAAVSGWLRTATHRLPAIQEELVHLVTDGRAIQGAGPTLAMRVPSPLIVVRPGVNEGDAYDEHGVRWLLTGGSMSPTWAVEHPTEWAARETLVCYDWPSGEACLIRVP